MVAFDLGVEDGQEECEVGPHAEEEPAMPQSMDCECAGGEDGERTRLLSKPRTPSKAEWERHSVSDIPFRDWCRHCVAGKERRHQKRPGTMINFHLRAWTWLSEQRCHTDVGRKGSTNRNGLCSPR